MSSVLYNRTGFKQHWLLLLNINLVQLHLMEGSSTAGVCQAEQKSSHLKRTTCKINDLYIDFFFLYFGVTSPLNPHISHMNWYKMANEWNEWMKESKWTCRAWWAAENRRHSSIVSAEVSSPLTVSCGLQTRAVCSVSHKHQPLIIQVAQECSYCWWRVG